jgi:hypothetical protein
MKILYVGNERRNAQAVATAVRDIARNVTPLWATSLDLCATCLDENRDLAALVIDAQVYVGEWPSSLRDLRSLHSRPAIVIVVPEGGRPKLESNGPPPDGYVTNGRTFLRDLPIAVTSAVTRVRGSQPMSPQSSDIEAQRPVQVAPERSKEEAPVRLERTACVDIEQKLATVTAAFRDAQRRHAAAMAAALVAHERAATEQLSEQEREFQSQIALEHDKRRAVEEMLTEAAGALEDAQRRHASALADAAAQTRELEHARALTADLAERAAQREAELVEQSQHERARRAALEQAVADADVTLRETRQRHDAALAAAAGELSEHRAQFDRQLSGTAGERDKLRQRLDEAEFALNQLRCDYESAASDMTRLTQREADLTAQLAHVEGARHGVESQLTDAVREIAAAKESAAREREAAEKHQAHLELGLAREIDAREILERTLQETRSAALDAERWFREEADALRAQGLEREASFDARLASERQEYHDRLAEVRNECEVLGEARAAADEVAQRLRADLSEATGVLENTRREFQKTLERLSAEHAKALAVLMAERDERLTEQAARHDVSLRASERARTELQERLQAALAAGRREIEQVQERLMATVETLEATKRRQDILQTEVDRGSELLEQPDESRAKSLRVLEQPRLAALQRNEDNALV